MCPLPRLRGRDREGVCTKSRAVPPSPPLPRKREREQTECAREECALTHPGKPHLLALVERLVEARKRGADGGGGGAHGSKALAHRLHAPDRGERGLGGAGGRKRVGGFERRGDELVEGNALPPAEPHVLLDLAHRPVAQHAGEFFAHAARAGRRWARRVARRSLFARGGLACRGIGAPAMPARGIVATLARIVTRLARVLCLAAGRGLRRIRGDRRRHLAIEPRLLLVVERAVKGLQRRLDDVVGLERRVDPLRHRLEPRRWRRRHLLRAVLDEPLRRPVGGVAQIRERVALRLVGGNRLRDRIKRPVLELGRLHGAAAHELVDGGAERPAAGAGQRSSARRGSAGFALACAPALLIPRVPRAALLLAHGAPVIAAAAKTLLAALLRAAPLVETPAPALVARIAGAIIAAVSPQILPEILLGAWRAAILTTRLPLVARLILILILPLRVAGAPPGVERGARGGALAVALLAAPIAVVAAARLGTRGHAHHQHRRKQHARSHHGLRPPLGLPYNAQGRPRVRCTRGALMPQALMPQTECSLPALGASPPPLAAELGLPEFGHILTGRSRIDPTSAGGLGRGHAQRLGSPPPPRPSPASGGGSRPSSRRPHEYLTQGCRALSRCLPLGQARGFRRKDLAWRCLHERKTTRARSSLSSASTRCSRRSASARAWRGSGGAFACASPSAWP